ncbi:MAPEG family protein [Deefgea piscis]|uniref:MAPEG family protein n=1 Tax=Deefgea piscis TaxID=2739061 RepID=UPI001C7FDE57|nr:MAPEG family protein [Deefgea piscis]QZA80066.1 MAPEG family protein [Deefgea piscis]
MQIVAMYAALLCLLYLYLTFRVIKLRRKFGAALGDQQQPELNRAIRAHANFAEYVPLCLLLLFLLEMQNAAHLLLQGLGLALLLGRILHAYAISQLKEQLKFRVAGMMLTLLTMLIAALALLFNTLF